MKTEFEWRKTADAREIIGRACMIDPERDHSPALTGSIMCGRYRNINCDLYMAAPYDRNYMCGEWASQ